MKSHLLGAVCTFICVLVPFTAHAATVQVDVSGNLLGATGVDVNGTTYNVTFIDGSCASLFGGCDEATDFDFQTEASASMAAQALMDQVFLDSTSGAFDTNPILTFGCETNSQNDCFAFTPYGILSSTSVFQVAAANKPSEAIDSISSYGAFNGDLSTQPRIVWADWQLVAPVPIPASVWLFSSGLLGLVGMARRRKVA